MLYKYPVLNKIFAIFISVVIIVLVSYGIASVGAYVNRPYLIAIFVLCSFGIFAIGLQFVLSVFNSINFMDNSIVLRYNLRVKKLNCADISYINLEFRKQNIFVSACNAIIIAEKKNYIFPCRFSNNADLVRDVQIFSQKNNIKFENQIIQT